VSEHDVTIDPERIEQELLLAGEPDPRDSRGGPTGAEGPDGPQRPWKEVAHLVGMGLQTGAPYWEIPNDKRDEFTGALEAVLDKHFPGGLQMAHTWGPWAQLVFVSGSIVAAHGIDWNTLTLKPLREPPPDEGEIGDPPEGEPEDPPSGKPKAAAGKKKAAKKKTAAAPGRATIG